MVAGKILMLIAAPMPHRCCVFPVSPHSTCPAPLLVELLPVHACSQSSCHLSVWKSANFVRGTFTLFPHGIFSPLKANCLGRWQLLGYHASSTVVCMVAVGVSVYLPCGEASTRCSFVTPLCNVRPVNWAALNRTRSSFMSRTSHFNCSTCTGHN